MSPVNTVTAMLQLDIDISRSSTSFSQMLVLLMDTGKSEKKENKVYLYKIISLIGWVRFFNVVT